jgi:hypothetical protein
MLPLRIGWRTLALSALHCDDSARGPQSARLELEKRQLAQLSGWMARNTRGGEDGYRRFES